MLVVRSVFSRSHDTERLFVFQIAQVGPDERYWTASKWRTIGDRLTVRAIKVVADGANLDDLIAKLRALGLDPRRVLAVQAGIEIPQYAIIFTLGRPGNEPGVR